MCMMQNKTQAFVSDYADAIMKLAKEDNVEIERERLVKALRKYPLEDVERMYDACLRFGLSNIFQAIE